MENTEGVLRDFIYNELQIECEMEFCNVHLLGDVETVTRDLLLYASCTVVN